MSLSRKSAVAGAYEHPTRFAPDKTMYQIMAESIRGALDDCGLTIKDVDGLLHRRDGHGRDGDCRLLRLPESDAQLSRCRPILAARRSSLIRPMRPPRLTPVCAKSPSIVYGSTAASSRFAIGTGGGGGGGDPCDQYEFPFGPTTVGAYAMIAQRHMHDYGTTPEATRRDRRHDAPACLDESGRQVSRSDHGRGRARLARYLVAVAFARLLHHQRWRWRVGHHLGRTRARPEEEARLYSWRGRDRAPCGPRPARLPRDRRGPVGPPRLRALRASPTKTSTWR